MEKKRWIQGIFWRQNKKNLGGFSGGSVVKNPPSNGGDGFDPWSRQIPHPVEQPSPRAVTTEPVLQSPRSTTSEVHTP